MKMNAFQIRDVQVGDLQSQVDHVGNPIIPYSVGLHSGCAAQEQMIGDLGNLRKHGKVHFIYEDPPGKFCK